MKSVPEARWRIASRPRSGGIRPAVPIEFKLEFINESMLVGIRTRDVLITPSSGGSGVVSTTVGACTGLVMKQYSA